MRPTPVGPSPILAIVVLVVAAVPNKGCQQAHKIPPTVRNDATSIRGWVEIVYQLGLDVGREDPSSFLIEPAIFGMATVDVAPEKLVDLYIHLMPAQGPDYFSMQAGTAAGALAEKGHFAHARRLMQKIRDKKGRAFGHVWIAPAYAKKGDLAAARNELENLTDPEWAAAGNRHVAWALSGSPRSDAAPEFIARIEDDDRRERVAWDAVLKLSANRHFEAARAVARIPADPEDREALVEHINFCERLFDENAKGIPQELEPAEDEIGDLVDALIDLKRLDRAVDLIEAHEYDFAKVDALLDVARALYLEGDYKRCENLLQQAKAAFDEEVSFVRAIGLMKAAVLEFQIGNRDAALETVEEVESTEETGDLDDFLSEEDLDPTAHALLGSLLVWQDRTKEIPEWYGQLDDPKARFYGALGVLRALSMDDELKLKPKGKAEREAEGGD